jgi:outer membrane receptor for ferrienterochelin and colicins
MKKVIILFLLIPYISLISNEIKGTVLGSDGEKKSPLPKATVKWLNTTIGTLTDEKGRFKINSTDKSNKLLVSYAGYKKDTIEVQPDSKFIEITIFSDLVLQQVNVVGRQSSSIISAVDPYKSETITLRGLQKAACCNLSESFQTNPSVDVNYADAITGAKQIQLLGLQGIYSQLMVEKIPTMTGIASTFGLNYIPGPFMESIQISKGMASVTTGYESMTGQINIEYKKPFNSDLLFINLYGSQEEKFEANVTSAFEITPNFSTIFMAHGSIMQNKIDDNEDGFLDIPLSQQLNLYNRWWYQGDGIEFQFGFKALTEKREGGQNDYFNNKSDVNLYGMEIKNNRYEFFLKNGYVFDTELFRSIGLIFSATHHNQNSFFGWKQYSGEQNSIYGNIIYQSEFDEKNKYFIGLSIKNDVIFENFKDTLTGLDISKGIRDTLLKRNELVPGFFAEYTYSGIDSLTIMAGIRADNNNIYGNLITPRLHLKYNFSAITNMRASIGRGFRSATILAENSQLFASSRQLFIDDKLELEKAWNYGMNLTTTVNFFGLPVTINSDFYRTEFDNQIIIDMEKDLSELHFYNLMGKSYSNSFQVDLSFEPVKRLEIRTAYRLNDVKMTINNQLVDKPFISKHKAFLNAAYSTNLDEWNFDFTADLNGGGRVPSSKQLPADNQMAEEFDPFVIFHGQITRKFEGFDVYLGAENIGDFTQSQAILYYKKPFSKFFDSSLIWGPIMGRNIYAGIRYTI